MGAQPVGKQLCILGFADDLQAAEPVGGRAFGIGVVVEQAVFCGEAVFIFVKCCCVAVGYEPCLEQ